MVLLWVLEVLAALHLAEVDFFAGDPKLFSPKTLILALLLDKAYFDLDGELESIVTQDWESQRVGD